VNSRFYQYLKRTETTNQVFGVTIGSPSSSERLAGDSTMVPFSISDASCDFSIVVYLATGSKFDRKFRKGGKEKKSEEKEFWRIFEFARLHGGRQG